MLTAIAALAFIATAQADGDPLAPGRAGQLQCVQPDRNNRTCTAMASFASPAPGRYRVTSVIAMFDDPPMTLTMAGDAQLVGGAVCGVLHREHYMTARLDAAGRAMPREQAMPLLEHMAQMSADSFGRTTCTTARADGDAFVQTGTVDGVPRPDLTLRYIWVGPDDGYVVRVSR